MSDKPQGGPSRPPYPSGSANPPPRSPSLYLSYLLRLWSHAGGGERGNWRASLESPMTHEQHHFPDLESLFAFLRTMTGPELAGGQEPGMGDMGGKENQSNL